MPSDANRSTVTLTTFHAWDGRKWVEQPPLPVTGNGPGWVREPLPPYSAVPACPHQWVYRPGLPGDILEYQCQLCQVWADAKRLEFLQQTPVSALPIVAPSGSPPADPILNAYARYDSDPRVNGPEDFEAFRDAVTPLLYECPECGTPICCACGVGIGT